ncbi:MAG TPA: DUF3090 family protein [Propionibacteriaceae bacterium]|nr:DUF3090 family protein [Propionibacteriaceae bacterium]
MSDLYAEFDDVDEFAVGALGEPGQRVFLLQCRHGDERITIKLEKQQAQAMSLYLRRVLEDLPQEQAVPKPTPIAPPFDAEFVLGEIGLGFEPEGSRVLVQLEEVEPTDEEGEPVTDAPRGHVRVFLSPGQALAFCEQSDDGVAGGRPLCRWCELPMNADGHLCPRMN